MVCLVVADFWLWTTGRRFGAVGAGVERGVLGGRVARKTESSRQGGGFNGGMEVRMRIEVIVGWEMEVVRWGGIAVWLGGWVGLVVGGWWSSRGLLLLVLRLLAVALCVCTQWSGCFLCRRKCMIFCTELYWIICAFGMSACGFG